MGINYNKLNWVCAILIAVLTSCGPSYEEMQAKEALRHPSGPASTVIDGVYKLPNSAFALGDGQYENITINKRPMLVVRWH